MQKVCHVAGGVKAYLKNPDCLFDEKTHPCPLPSCPFKGRHRLHRHCWYERWALFPSGRKDRRIPVLRLLCVHMGATVSLLPDFCLPRRQQGPEILAMFLVALAVKGLPLDKAYRKARPKARGHSRAQHLLKKFLENKIKIKSYLARIHFRVVELPSTIPRNRKSLAELVLGLTQGYQDEKSAFIDHGREFHAFACCGLA